jgi:hypothetical protein
MQIGELPGPDGKLPGREPIDVAMDRVRECFIGRYDDPTSGDYSIWLVLTEAARPVAEALRAGVTTSTTVLSYADVQSR